MANPSRKPVILEGEFAGRHHKTHIAGWSRITGKSKGYFEHRLKRGQDMQTALNDIPVSSEEVKNRFLYGGKH